MYFPQEAANCGDVPLQSIEAVASGVVDAMCLPCGYKQQGHVYAEGRGVARALGHPGWPSNDRSQTAVIIEGL